MESKLLELFLNGEENTTIALQYIIGAADDDEELFTFLEKLQDIAIKPDKRLFKVSIPKQQHSKLLIETFYFAGEVFLYIVLHEFPDIPTHLEQYIAKHKRVVSASGFVVYSSAKYKSSSLALQYKFKHDANLYSTDVFGSTKYVITYGYKAKDIAELKEFATELNNLITFYT